MHTFQQKVTMLGSLSCALRTQVNIFKRKKYNGTSSQSKLTLHE